jgi:hypothetical protein
VAVGGGDAGVAVEDAENRNAQRFDRFAEHRLVGRRTDAVQDHAGHPQLRVERRVTVYQRRHRARHRSRIYDEQDRRAEQLRHVGRRCVLPTPALTVEEPHHTLHHADIGPPGAVGEERAYKVRAGEECVEVATRPAGGERVVGGIYKVRADLEGSDPVASRGERGHQARGDRGLPGAGVGACNNYAG